MVKFPEETKAKWYAVYTYPGHEDAVVRYIKQRVESLEMEDKIFDAIVPREKKIKIVRGKRQVVDEKIYPGYVLVKMIMDEDSWYVVRNTPRVSGFVGSDPSHPTPLSAQEVESLMERMGKKEVEFEINLKPGDTVKILQGPLRDKEGTVAEIDQKQNKVKVKIPIFGRETTVELDVLQVKRV